MKAATITLYFLPFFDGKETKAVNTMLTYSHKNICLFTHREQHSPGDMDFTELAFVS